MKLKKFKKKTAVKINSKEDYLLLMELAEKAGWKWLSGHNATHFNNQDGYYNSDYICFTKFNKTLSRASELVIGDSSNDYKVITMRQAVKFEVGDKVRIRKDLDKLDATEPPKITDGMLDAAGDEHIITNISTGNKPNWYHLDSNMYSWLKKWLQPVASYDSEQESKPEKYYTGKVVFLESGVGITKGKIYTFENGFFVDDDGDKRPSQVPPCDSIDDVKHVFFDCIEVVE